MKINGKVVNGPYVDCIVFPRNGFDIQIKASAILDESDFDKMSPRPKAPYISEPGKEPYRNVEDPTYKAAIEDWAKRKGHWLNIKALECNNIEWDTVKLGDPNTWENWTQDFKVAGFSEMEIIRIIMLIHQVNALDESKLDEAKKRFLAGQVLTSEDKTS